MDAIEHPPILSLTPVGHPRSRVLHVGGDGRSSIVVSLAATPAAASWCPRGVAELHGGRARAVPRRCSTTSSATRGAASCPLIGTLGLFILAVEPARPRARDGRAHRQPQHHGGVRDHRVLLLPLRRDPQARASWRYLKHFCGPVWCARAPHVPDRDRQPLRARRCRCRSGSSATWRRGHILLAVIFLLTGLHGLVGWALGGQRSAGSSWASPAPPSSSPSPRGFLLPLKILVAFLQAFIFCMLSMLYLAGAVEERRAPLVLHPLPKEASSCDAHCC